MKRIHVIYADYEKLQKLQHEPFFFSDSTPLRWMWKPRSIGVLYRLLREYRLNPYWKPFETVDPCVGIVNYDAPVGSEERFIDGPRMFEADGIVNFQGAFENFSFGFGYFTNVPQIIAKLRKAIAWNLANYEVLK